MFDKSRARFVHSIVNKAQTMPPGLLWGGDMYHPQAGFFPASLACGIFEGQRKSDNIEGNRLVKMTG